MVIILLDAIRKNNWTFEKNFSIIFSGTNAECYKLEKIFRPKPMIGLNEAIGGQGGYTLYTQERSEKISKIHSGRIFSREHKKKISETCSDGRRKGPNNANAKNWKLISPTGKKYSLKGKLLTFCDEHDILVDTLRYYRGKDVPEIKTGTIGGYRMKNEVSFRKRKNTSGWRLL
tara:strand:+ start:1290 stop:1811 length:522 start_codon:yes stop_codon:yes gene_type:complete